MLRSVIIFLLLSFVSTNLFCQDALATINAIEQRMKKHELNLSAVLSSNEWMYLHPVTEFRQMIKRNATASPLIISPLDETGKRIKVKGVIKSEDGKPLKDVLIYVYHTSDKGWYAADAPHILIMEGDMRHARLFGYLKSDANGKFEIETIQPKGYPNSDLPAHIHIQLWQNGKGLHGPGELLFDDDERLTPERRKRAMQDGFLISKNTGKEETVFEYIIYAKD